MTDGDKFGAGPSKTGAGATQCVLALDVGGTGLKGAVFDVDGDSLVQLERPTPTDLGPAAVVEAVLAATRDLLASATSKQTHDSMVDVVGAAVVVPGVVDAEAGIARYSSNIGWRDVPLRDLVQNELGLQVAVDHDVRSAGVAEATLGTLRGIDHGLFVPIGTGIAAAMIVGGTVHRGASGLAGELGHVIVHPGGERCGCGQHGCVEAYASASAIARRYARLSGRSATAEQVCGLISTDPAAAETWDDAVAALVLALAAYTSVMDPQAITLGGGLAEAGTTLLTPVREQLAETLTWRDPPTVELAALGAGAARIGAAILAWTDAGRPEITSTWTDRR